MLLCNQLLLCSYGNFPSLAHHLLSPQLLLFVFHPKTSTAYSEGDGVRSVGQPDSKQKGTFVEGPFPGFPVRLVNEGAKGVNGFASAVLASAGLGKGPCPPFLPDGLEGGHVGARSPPTPGIYCGLDVSRHWAAICSIQHAVEEHLHGKPAATSPRRGWGMPRLRVNHRRKPICCCRDEGLVGHKRFSCSNSCSRVHEDLPGDPQSHFWQGEITV